MEDTFRIALGEPGCNLLRVTFWGEPTEGSDLPPGEFLLDSPN
jgi:hypothetical protein